MKVRFDAQGRRLLPTYGLPTDLLRDVMMLQGEWMTDDIRRACDVLDNWVDYKRKGSLWPAGRGRQPGNSIKSDPDETAVNAMATIAFATGIRTAETLAKKVLDRGIGKRGHSRTADIKRLAGKYSRTPKLWLPKN
jgi:hypothetical protein